MNRIMLFSGVILMASIFIFFPDYSIPIQKESYRIVTGEMVVFFIGAAQFIIGVKSK